MNSSDWAVIYTPLITELVKALLGLIFGGTKRKTRIVNKYTKGGKHEGTHFDADNYSASGKLRF